jgi:predicted transcriptional regulator
VTVQDIAEVSGLSEKTVRRHLKEHGGFWIEGSEVGLKDRDKTE